MKEVMLTIMAIGKDLWTPGETVFIELVKISFIMEERHCEN